MPCRTSLVILAVLLLDSTSGGAQPADALLQMCLRDGSNAVRRLRRDRRAGASSFRRFEKNCVTGPRAAAIRSLAGYPRVLEVHAEAKALLTAAHAPAAPSRHPVRTPRSPPSAPPAPPAGGARATPGAGAAGPGGGFNAVRARWRARPKRCVTVEAWNKAAGVEPAPRGTARLVGVKTTGPGRAAHWRAFARRSGGGQWPHDFTPDDHLARIICGHGVEGIDSYFSARSDVSGTQLLPGDARLALGEAVVNRRGDEAHLVLYQVALIGECFRATQWNVAKDYLPYVLCRDAVGTPPTPSAVKDAVQRVFPGRDFERQNAAFILEQGIQAMAETDAAFAKVEARYPRLRAVFRTPAKRARERFARRHKRDGAAYRVLAPITARLRRDLNSTPPAPCAARILELQRKLVAATKAHTPKQITDLRVRRPLGYQITEALVYCDIGEGKLARAFMNARALDHANRRVSRSEAIFFARLDAFTKLEQDLGGAGRLAQVLGPHGAFSFISMRPVTGRLARGLLRKVKGMGKYEVLGEKARTPAIVSAVTPVAKGAKLVFKKNKFVYKHRNVSCRETNRIDRYELDGRTIRPVYRRDCREVGPVLTEVIVYQEDPVVVPPEDAAMIRKGMQAIVLNNTRVVGDAVITDLWWPKRGRAQALVVQGIRVR